MRLHQFVIGFLLLVALAACGRATNTTAPAPTPAATAGVPTALPEPTGAPTVAPEPTVAPTAAPTAMPTTLSIAEVLVTYHKTGGIMGMDELLTVGGDGSLTLQARKEARKTGQADAAQIAELTRLLGGPEFAALAPRYEILGADMFVYEISVPGRAQPVVTMDGAENPTVLTEVLGLLEQLRKSVR